MKIASIDLGSNSLRLLLAESDGKKLEIIQEFIRSPRAGMGVKESREISPRSMLRVLEILRRCRLFWKQFEVDKIVGVATAFSREAKNWHSLSNAIMREVDVEFHSLSSEEEAELGFLGATYDINDTNNLSLIDIGGGSTEIITKNKTLHTTALHIGALNLTEVFLKSDPPTKKEINKLKRELKNQLKISQPKALAGSKFGIGGTFTTLALLAQNKKFYDVEKVDYYDIKRDDVLSILEKLCSLRRIEREELLPWDRKRAEILPAGTLICESIMDYFQWDKITIRHRGLVHGLAIQASMGC